MDCIGCSKESTAAALFEMIAPDWNGSSEISVSWGTNGYSILSPFLSATTHGNYQKVRAHT